jgi:hypothetical protein
VAQDVGFSVRKPGFDSPWGYYNGRAARDCEWRGRFAFPAGP